MLVEPAAGSTWNGWPDAHGIAGRMSVVRATLRSGRTSLHVGHVGTPPEGAVQQATAPRPPGTAILLGTYNGEMFLGEQLRSIVAQTDPDWTILIRDDGSTDGTLAVVDGFRASREDRIACLDSVPGRLGALGNFMMLLAHAPSAQRYAFADQDDVWLPDKLARAARALDQEPAGIPVLYCARQSIVDDALREIGLSPALRHPPSFRNALVQNIATGCTVVMNAAARQTVLAVPPPERTLHDWWAYLVTTAIGGRVIFDPQPVLLYRQHVGNAVGSAPALLSRAVSAARRGPVTFMQRMMAHVEALLRHPGLTPDARGVLEQLHELPQAGLLRKLALVRAVGIYRQGRLDDLTLRLWLAVWHLAGAKP